MLLTLLISSLIPLSHAAVAGPGLYEKIFMNTLWRKSIMITNGQKRLERVNSIEFFPQDKKSQDSSTRTITTDWLDSQGASGHAVKEKLTPLTAREGLMRIYLSDGKNPELYTLMMPTAFGECLLPHKGQFPEDCYWKQ